FLRRDIRKILFVDGVFDKVTCRLVFHHILNNRQKAMDECYRVLKKGGTMLLSEGVPPTNRVKKDYIKIFRLKERRVTFMEEDLMDLMKKSGFKEIKCETVYLKRMSVKNWLVNSGLRKSVQKKIFLLHKDAADHFKRDYNMVETADDCLIDMKMAIVIGEKIVR
ncbi:MAG: methyltransferase domain-containing protein, partial [Candidatus Omnitrophota bacterium]|nr:methyltransferase domain-containing protein [Candidatus Omnitrophota bacterium]